MKPAVRNSARSQASGRGNKKKEVYFRSGTQRAAGNVEDVHDDIVDSNIIRAINAKKSEKMDRRRSKRSSARGANSSRSMPAQASNRMSKRGGRAGADNSTTMIIGGFAGLLVIVGLVMAMSGDSGGSRSRTPSSRGGGPQSSAYHVKRAQEFLRKGENFAASDEYRYAAEAAERSGNSADASRYQQAAYGLAKHTPLKLQRR